MAQKTKSTSKKETPKASETKSKKTDEKKKVTKTTVPKKSPPRKPTPKSKTAKSTVKTKRLSNEVKGIMLIALGSFIALALLTGATGVIGNLIKLVCYGLFGSAAAILFIVVILTGLNIFFDKKSENNAYKAWFIFVIMLFGAVISALMVHDTEFVGGGFASNINSLYSSGVAADGGGILGGGLCKIFVKLIGVSGTWILSIATELVFVILLTGISIEALISKIASKLKQHSQEIIQRAGETVDFDTDDTQNKENKKNRKNRKNKDNSDESITDDGFELPEHSKAPKFLQNKKNKKNRNGADENIEMPPDKEKYFNNYFNDDEPTLENIPNSILEDDGIKSSKTEPKRFELKEDDTLLQSILSASEQSSPSDLPFDIDTMKTGVLTELPDENGNIPKTPDPDGLDFEPPSEAKLEDALDPLTKKALDAGVPLDESVTKGRKMLLDDTETLDKTIEKDIELAMSAPRVIQYKMPSLDLLELPKARSKTLEEVKYELEEKANRLLDTLRSFKVEAKIVNITQGPTVTRFELQPGFGVKVSKITGLSDDIALSLAASGVRIEAPIPGKSAIGIEIPNTNPRPVPIREVIDSEKFRSFKSKTAFALGKDIGGNSIVADVASFPHVLIAGATGSGKSVCINSLITSILYKANPDEVKMIMIDPKMVELGIYNGIPHLLIPVVTDPKHAAAALNWAVTEMKNRYNLLKDNKARNLKGYNAIMEEIGEPESKLPEIVIIIDELADLMMAAKNEVENAINSLAALARAAGMYLVIATQRPSVNVITGVIKANVPSRISFAVASQIDSRTIIDAPGAEKLLGKGDMLYNPKGEIKPIRIQGNFVSDSEIEGIIEYIKNQYEAEYDEKIIETIEKEHERVSADLDSDSNSEISSTRVTSGGTARHDELFMQGVEMVLESGQASVAMFQRKFKIGYQRAARLIDQMEESHIIGPYEGTKPRQVLITRMEFNEMKMNNGD